MPQLHIGLQESAGDVAAQVGAAQEPGRRGDDFGNGIVGEGNFPGLRAGEVDDSCHAFRGQVVGQQHGIIGLDLFGLNLQDHGLFIHLSGELAVIRPLYHGLEAA